VRADLYCFGKVIGGGLPVGAFGGSREVLSALAPAGPVYQAGTLSGNPLATAAGAEVLSRVSPRDYAELSERVGRFAAAMAEAVGSAGLVARTPVEGPLMGLYLAREEFEEPRDFEEARRLCDNGLYRAFFHAMLDQGVALAPGAYEILFVSLAHSDEDLSRTVEAAGVAAGRAATATS
jgi:glutamate-1-semialdehyde 2,1-aminomutase